MTLARRYLAARRTTPPAPPAYADTVAVCWNGGISGEHTAGFNGHGGVAVGGWVSWLRPVASVYEPQAGPVDVCAYVAGYLRWLIPPGPWVLRPGDAVALIEPPQELGPPEPVLRVALAPPPPPTPPIKRVELPPAAPPLPEPSLPYAASGETVRTFRPYLDTSAKAWLDEMAAVYGLNQAQTVAALACAWAGWERKQQSRIIDYVKGRE